MTAGGQGGGDNQDWDWSQGPPPDVQQWQHLTKDPWHHPTEEWVDPRPQQGVPAIPGPPVVPPPRKSNRGLLLGLAWQAPWLSDGDDDAVVGTALSADRMTILSTKRSGVVAYQMSDGKRTWTADVPGESRMCSATQSAPEAVAARLRLRLPRHRAVRRGRHRRQRPGRVSRSPSARLARTTSAVARPVTLRRRASRCLSSPGASSTVDNSVEAPASSTCHRPWFALDTGTQTFRQALSATGQVAVVNGSDEGDPVVVSFADGRSGPQAGRPTGPPQPELITLDVASGGAPKPAKLDREDFSTSMWDFEFLLAGPHLVGAAKEAASDPDPGTESPEDAELVAYRVG